MIVQNLSDGKSFIKHETNVDPDNEFNLIENISDELIAFDEFFKDAMRKDIIAVQIFEFVDADTKFSDYFAQKRSWEDTPNWNVWFENFKNKHSLYLYFYKPEDRKREVISGTVDMDYSIVPKFKPDQTETEYFEIKDYFVNESDATHTFQVYINTDVIYECLKKSKIEECQHLLRGFSLYFLNNTLNNTLTINSQFNSKIKI